MEIEYSREFIKNAKLLTGKLRESLQQVIMEVKNATDVHQLSDCKRLKGFKSIYRIRLGDSRVFFQFHVKIANGKVFFILISNRGQAYSKEMEKKLRNLDI